MNISDTTASLQRILIFFAYIKKGPKILPCHKFTKGNLGNMS